MKRVLQFANVLYHRNWDEAYNKINNNMKIIIIIMIIGNHIEYTFYVQSQQMNSIWTKINRNKLEFVPEIKIFARIKNYLHRLLKQIPNVIWYIKWTIRDKWKHAHETFLQKQPMISIQNRYSSWLVFIQGGFHYRKYRMYTELPNKKNE